MTNKISTFVKLHMNERLDFFAFIETQENQEKANHSGNYHHQVLHKLVGSMTAQVLKKSIHKFMFIFYSNDYAHNIICNEIILNECRNKQNRSIFNDCLRLFGPLYVSLFPLSLFLFSIE